MDGVTALGAQLEEYRKRWPEEGATAGLFEELLTDGEDPFVRERLTGHFTGSAWLVDASGERALLTHHRKLGIWVQPGGHADGDRDLTRVALREAEEESGLAGLTTDGALFDIDRHGIPERGDVPGHWHYDARYVLRAGTDEEFVVGTESLDLAWRDVRELADAAGTGPSLRRMAVKWLARERQLPGRRVTTTA